MVRLQNHFHQKVIQTDRPEDLLLVVFQLEGQEDQMPERKDLLTARPTEDRKEGKEVSPNLMRKGEKDPVETDPKEALVQIVNLMEINLLKSVQKVPEERKDQEDRLEINLLKSVQKVPDEIKDYQDRLEINLLKSAQRVPEERKDLEDRLEKSLLEKTKDRKELLVRGVLSGSHILTSLMKKEEKDLEQTDHKEVLVQTVNLMEINLQDLMDQGVRIESRFHPDQEKEDQKEAKGKRGHEVLVEGKENLMLDQIADRKEEPGAKGRGQILFPKKEEVLKAEIKAEGVHKIATVNQLVPETFPKTGNFLVQEHLGKENLQTDIQNR